MAALLHEEGVPLLIHQPSYNLFNRWPEAGLLDALEAVGSGMIAFTALAQGLLSDKYLDGIPADSRINRPGGDSFPREALNPENLDRVRALNEIAKRRGQSLAQMAYAWVLRDPRVTSTLIGASSAGPGPRERRRSREHGVLARGAGRDRPVRRRRRGQPVGGPEHGPAPVAQGAAGRRCEASALLGVVVAIAACSTPVVPVTPGPSLTPVPTTMAASPVTPVIPTPAAPADEVRVTLGIYSGRPDPDMDAHRR